MSTIEQASEIFFDNRRAHRLIDNLPDALRPSDLATAYAIQADVVRRELDALGGDFVGYKIACTNEYAQRLLQMDAPVFGRLISPRVYRNGSQLRAADFHLRCVESEYAFEMGADVPPRDEPYSRESIAPFVGAVLPSIEIVDHHFTDWTSVGGLAVAADNAIHGCWIPGEPRADWQPLDLQQQTVTLRVNGEISTTGSGANVLGHPVNVLAWLANELPRFDLALKRGDRVTTGITTEVYLAEAGDDLLADFGPLGEVRLSFA